MTARFGEKAATDEELRCGNCGGSVRVSGGHRIPKCPRCGYATFTTRGPAAGSGGGVRAG